MFLSICFQLRREYSPLKGIIYLLKQIFFFGGEGVPWGSALQILSGIMTVEIMDIPREISQNKIYLREKFL